jgi:hypothetical protein
MTFYEDLQAQLVIHNEKFVYEKNRIIELGEFMNSIRLIRQDCELISDHTCTDTLFISRKKHVCDFISNILNIFYKCRNGQFEYINKLEKHIIIYQEYMTKIDNN